MICSGKNFRWCKSLLKEKIMGKFNEYYTADIIVK